MPGELLSPLSPSRYRGCLLGLAVGDATGTMVEFLSRTASSPKLVEAYYWKENIPAEWRSKLTMLDVIITFADKLWESAQRL